MIFKNLLLLCLALVGLACHRLQAQDLGNSPYSQTGIGDIRSQAFSHQAGMAGIGAAFDLPFQINNINPALLAKIRRTILDVGVTSKLTLLNQDEQSQRDFGAGLSHMALAFPIARRMSASIGLQSFSSVNYENSFVQQVENSDFTADVTYKGSGGLSNAFFSTAIDLLGKNNFRPDTLKSRLLLGIKVNYIFGAVIDESITQVNGGANQNDYEIAFKKRTTYTDFTFEPGIAFSQNIGKDYRLNLGLVYNLGRDLNAKRFISVDRRVQGVNTDADTLVNNERGRVTLASKATMGFSFEKVVAQTGLPKWAIAADVSLQNWDTFKNFETSTTLGQNMVVALGGLFIPDFGSVQKGFWKRSIYRVGLRYEQTPFTFNGENVEDYSLSAGISLPFGRSSTTLNLSLTGGQRGTKSNSLIRERYFQAHFGVTINDTWFIKRRFD